MITGERKYLTPCNEAGYQRVLADIGTGKFPGSLPPPEEGARRRPMPTDTSVWGDAKRPAFEPAYCAAPNLNPLKVQLLRPVAAYCSVSFKYGYLVVREAATPGDEHRREMIWYLEELGAKWAESTERRGGLFSLSRPVSDAKLKLKGKLRRARKELEDLYRDALPLAVELGSGDASDSMGSAEESAPAFI